MFKENIAIFQTIFSPLLELLILVHFTHRCAVMKFIPECAGFFCNQLIYFTILRYFFWLCKFPGSLVTSVACLKILLPTGM